MEETMWEKAELMFPVGVVPNSNSTIEDLRNSPNITAVRILQTKMARDMVVHQYEEVWTNDNQHYMNEIYNVYKDPSVNLERHLSVYGAKMLTDVRNRKKMEKENVRFNYTGLQ